MQEDNKKTNLFLIIGIGGVVLGVLFGTGII